MTNCVEENKCTPKKEAYAETLCKWIVEATDRAPTKRSRGLFRLNMVNIETKAELGQKIIVKSGDYVDHGVVLNFCPFCGGKLHNQYDY